MNLCATSRIGRLGALALATMFTTTGCPEMPTDVVAPPPSQGGQRAGPHYASGAAPPSPQTASLPDDRWIPTRFQADKEPLVVVDPNRGWATADVACPDRFVHPGGGEAMWFHFDDLDGDSGIGLARLEGERWEVAPTPALRASDAGLTHIGCSSTAAWQGELEILIGATDDQDQHGILRAQLGAEGDLQIATDTPWIYAEPVQAGLSDPALLRDGDLWRLYARRGRELKGEIVMYSSPDGASWEGGQASVIRTAPTSNTEIFGSPFVFRKDGLYYLWVAVQRHRRQPGRRAPTDRSSVDVQYAVLYAASEDPAEFGMELNPIVLKPGRDMWKAVMVDGPSVVQEPEGLTMYFRGTDPAGQGSIGRGSAQFRPKSNEASVDEQARLAPLQISPGHEMAPATLVTTAQGGARLTVGTLTHELAMIPSGTFTMGSPIEEDGRDPDEFLHSVTISQPFLLGTTEVTQELFEAVLGVNPAEFEGPQRPVEQISWDDAVLFCNTLSQALGLRPAYRGSGNEVTWDRQANGIRLPTEAEWEHAARAGRQGMIFAVEGPLADSAWYEDSSDAQTHPVGQLRPNPWGLYDLNGNVYEWVWDRKGHYQADVIDPSGPDSKTLFRVERGGSFRNGERNTRTANRGRFEHYQRSFNLGLRIAQGTPGPAADATP